MPSPMLAPIPDDGGQAPGYYHFDSGYIVPDWVVTHVAIVFHRRRPLHNVTGSPSSIALMIHHKAQGPKTEVQKTYDPGRPNTCT